MTTHTCRIIKLADYQKIRGISSIESNKIQGSSPSSADEAQNSQLKIIGLWLGLILVSFIALSREVNTTNKWHGAYAAAW